VKKKIPKPREKAFVCMFYDRASHLDEFCFHRKRIEKMRFDYAGNSYHDELSDFLPRSFSHASPHTSSHVLSHFSHGSNYCSYNFGSRDNSFVSKRFGYDPHPQCGDRFPHMPSFPVRGSRTHLEPRHLDNPHFPRHGSRPTRPNGKVQRTVKTSSGHMIKCWISKIYLTNPSTELSTSSRPM
jgi:hypothetical protein